jgi:hypothetical protein
VYASFFKDARDIVDLRRMIKDTARSDASFDVFAQSCDTFHRRVVVFEDAKTDLHILMNSAILRYSAKFDDPSRSTLAFEIIRKLFKDLGYDKPQDGGIKWQDIPILGEALRGSRRGSAAMASDTKLTSADRVRAPIAPRWAEEWKENVEGLWYGGDFNFSETEQGCRNQDAIYQRNDH